MRIVFISLLLFLLIACNFPGISVSDATPATTSTTALSLAGSTAELPRPTPTLAPLGTQANPLVLALSPTLTTNDERIEAGKAFAAQLTDETGYTFVVVSPNSYMNLIEALGRGNAHIVVLSAYAYALAYEKGYVTAVLASLKSGEKAYGAQFIARADAGFVSYYDPYTQENLADATTALSQFRDKKPCWADVDSPSGYVIPAGVLAHNQISIHPAAFLQGQPTVARAVYAGGICDFGATYIDARQFPVLLDDFPDIMEKVNVIWRIPSIIPYENLALASGLPPDITKQLTNALFRISGMQAGRQVLGQAYGIEHWEQVTDAFYTDFLMYLEASSLELEELLDDNL